jgi:protoporphyrinogen oxidase
MTQDRPHVVVIGAGFTGLSAGYELAEAGVRVTLLEAEAEIGGLAGGFRLGDTTLERFYHHWFNHDHHVMALVDELGVADQVVTRPSRTGMYFAGGLHRLSTPLDVLRFKPLSLIDRIRLVRLVLVARRHSDWKALDHVSAADWLRRIGGENVFRIVWEPLLLGKFGTYAYDVSAAWFWAKLVLRGGSRKRTGGEQLAYFRGGFAAVAERIAAHIKARGGEIRRRAPALGVKVHGGRAVGVRIPGSTIQCDAVLATPALPIIADLLGPHVPEAYRQRLERVRYLGNICLVLQLQRSLSGLYWMNVNDPSFPFVGIIEHTNFEPSASYQNRHIVYLSKYLPVEDALYGMSDAELLAFALPHIQRMFPAFEASWILDHHVWRARYAQPVVTTGYAASVPGHQTPLEGFHIATMAQIYPEDRGTNFAIRDGRRVAQQMMTELRSISRAPLLAGAASGC